jgi:Fe2+ transport system protein FeoA
MSSSLPQAPHPAAQDPKPCEHGCQLPQDLACHAGTCTLDCLGIGRTGSVLDIISSQPDATTNDDVRRRLMEMGLCNGTEVTVVRKSPFGDPIEIRLRGYHLSLRKQQARCVRVRPVSA